MHVDHTLIIRPARETDSPAIAALIDSLVPHILAAPGAPAAEAFMASISPAAIAGYIRNPDYRYLLGFIGETLVGAAAIRDDNHLYHLFVDGQFHRRGIATALWTQLREAAMEAGNTGEFTVNSSINAIAVYSRLGFVAVGEVQHKNGLQFQPMRLATER
nr:GNAT family N-acetyltransferase [uncultured Pseudomonas sp.]